MNPNEKLTNYWAEETGLVDDGDTGAFTHSRLRTASDVDMESLAVHVMPECRCLVVVHPSDRRPFDWIGRNAIMKLNEETWDMLLVLVEPDREQAVTTASWGVLGDVAAGRE